MTACVEYANDTSYAWSGSLGCAQCRSRRTPINGDWTSSPSVTAAMSIDSGEADARYVGQVEGHFARLGLER